MVFFSIFSVLSYFLVVTFIRTDDELTDFMFHKQLLRNLQLLLPLDTEVDQGFLSPKKQRVGLSLALDQKSMKKSSIVPEKF